MKTNTSVVNNNNTLEIHRLGRSSAPITFTYYQRLVNLLVGNGVFLAVATELVTQVPPERIRKEIERLRRISTHGPVKQPEGWLAMCLRGPDKPLPDWHEADPGDHRD